MKKQIKVVLLFALSIALGVAAQATVKSATSAAVVGEIEVCSGSGARCAFWGAVEKGLNDPFIRITF